MKSNSFLKATILGLAVVFIAGAVLDAEAGPTRRRGDPYPRPYPQPQPPPPPPYNPPPYNPPSHPGYGVEQKVIYMNRWVSFETLPLRQLADLDRDARGMLVESIEVTTRSQNHNSTMALLVNEQVVDTASSHSSFVTLFTRWGMDELGREIQTLKLDVRGQIFIDQIRINLRRGNGGYNPPHQPQQQILDSNIFRQFVGDNRLDIGNLVGMMRFQGFHVEEVMIEASTAAGNGQAELLVNGMSASAPQTVGRYPQQISFFMGSYNDEIGREIRSLELHMRGNFTVNRVSVRVSRR